MGAGHAHALYVHEHSPIHRLAPQVKIIAAVSFILVVAITPRETAWAFGAYAGALGAVMLLGRVRFRFVAMRVLGVLPFIAFAFLVPFVAGGDTVDVFGLELSSEGLWSAWNIVAKATIGAATSIVLMATTEVSDLLAGMARLRVPAVMTAIAGFMIRYLEVIAGEVGRTRIAMQARAYRPRWLWETRPLASATGALFIRSYERGERVHAAMLARGFTGEMPDLRGRRPGIGEWATALALPSLALAILLLSMGAR